MARSLVGHPFDFESKIRGRKSEANNFCGECQLVAAGNQVMVAIATDERLSLFAKPQMNRVHGLPCLAPLKHDVDFLIVVQQAATSPCILL